MGAAADGQILLGGEGRLFGIDHLEFLDAALFQLVPHDPRQRANGGFVDIRHLKGRGIHFVARPHAADDGRTCPLCLLDKLQLAGNGVDGIHHIIILAEVKQRRRLGRIKGFVGVYNDIGAYILDALLRHIHLVLPHGFAGGEDLAVQVCQANSIIVDEIQRANAAAGQCLHGIAAHAPNAKHRHTGPVQPRDAVLL